MARRASTFSAAICVSAGVGAQARTFVLEQRWASLRAMQRSREEAPRPRCHADLREVIADMNPLSRGWGQLLPNGNAARRFNQFDGYSGAALNALHVKRKGRTYVQAKPLLACRIAPPARNHPLPGAALLERRGCVWRGTGEPCAGTPHARSNRALGRGCVPDLHGTKVRRDAHWHCSCCASLAYRFDSECKSGPELEWMTAPYSAEYTGSL
jgi:hypothetical protein